MTDKEIVKALECCTNCDCKSCPAYVDNCHCHDIDYKQVLDLINRLQAQNNKYRRKVQNQREAINFIQAKNERLKTEFDNYKQIAEHQQSVTLDRGFEIKRLKEKIERLEKAVNDKGGFILIADAKAEAYKEFAENAVERVEKVKLKYQRLCKEQGEEMEEHMHIHFNGIIKIINNLLKELVGEDE